MRDFYKGYWTTIYYASKCVKSRQTQIFYLQYKTYLKKVKQYLSLNDKWRNLDIQ